MPELLPPVVDLGPDINIELGDTIRLEALVNGPYESLLWSPSSDFADPTLPVQRVSPSETMAFTVVVRDEYGCQVIQHPDHRSEADTGFHSGCIFTQWRRAK